MVSYERLKAPTSSCVVVSKAGLPESLARTVTLYFPFNALLRGFSILEREVAQYTAS